MNTNPTVREGSCPVCGKSLRIPAELTAFSCLYCGARLTVEQLIPPPASPAFSEDKFLACYNTAVSGILACVTDHQNSIRSLNRTAFEPYFQSYEKDCLPVFLQLEQAVQMRPEAGGEILDRFASDFIAQLQDWLARQKRRVAEDDAKYTVCLFLIPALRRAGLDISEPLAVLIREKWLERYPKNVFQLTTYEDIAGGFRKKLCFITTAVCGALGKPDNCPELTAFRTFRDDYLALRPEGPGLIDTYYAIAPAIVTILNLTRDSDAAYQEIWRRHLSPCYNAILQGNPAECQARYTAMVQALAQDCLGIPIP